MIKEAQQFYQTRAAWVGAGGHPVPKHHAQFRADICVQCPMNKEKPIYEMLAAPVALLAKRQIALKNKMNLRVDGEKSLHVCDACDCILKLKVWVPIEFIDANHEFHPSCWIPIENK